MLEPPGRWFIQVLYRFCEAFASPGDYFEGGRTRLSGGEGDDRDLVVRPSQLRYQASPGYRYELRTGPLIPSKVCGDEARGPMGN